MKYIGIHDAFSNAIGIVQHKGKVEEYIANVLYYPSYLSLEYVLQKEGLIPEAVYVYTSITAKTTRLFANSLGTFSYRHVKEELFTGFVPVHFSENYQIKIATKAKALFDFLYLRPIPESYTALSHMLFEDLRMQWGLFTKEDMTEFMHFTELASSPKMQRIRKAMERRLS